MNLLGVDDLRLQQAPAAIAGRPSDASMVRGISVAHLELLGLRYWKD